MPPKPGMIPRLISGWPNDGRGGRDPQIAAHRELATAAEGERVDGGDRRHVLGLELAQQRVCVAGQLLAAGLVELGERLDVGAGAEDDGDRGGDDHRVDRSSALTLSQTMRRSRITLGLSAFIGMFASQAIATPCSGRVSSLTVSACSPSSACG